jgi:signal transduction histidine kinase
MSALADPKLFDTPPEDDFDRLTELAMLLTGAPVALLSLVDETRQFFKSARGLPEPWASLRGTPISHSFCKTVVETGEQLVVPDATIHPKLRTNPAIAELGVIAYLGEPVRAPSGGIIGSFCAIDHERRVWSDRERHIIATLARSVENAIALRAATEAQKAAMDDLMRINRALSLQSVELASARNAAEKALSQQTRFLAGLSHELKTPLNGVLGGVALLETADDPDAQARCRQMIRASSRALVGCVNELIAYCRVGAGIEKPAFAAFEPRSTAAAAADAVRAIASERSLEVTVEVDAAVPSSWVSDAKRIEQILVNLLGNAVKYTSAGRIRVSVRMWGDALAFRVSDTGWGVPPEHHDGIFEPFNRGDPGLSGKTSGTGLGLAIARETAERIGGSLTLERSAPGEGSTFLLLAPQPCGIDAEKAVAATG